MRLIAIAGLLALLSGCESIETVDVQPPPEPALHGPRDCQNPDKAQHPEYLAECGNQHTGRGERTN